MRKMRVFFLLIPLLFSLAMSPAWAQSPMGESGEAVYVGRIAYVEGQLLRYVPEQKDWVAAVNDAPFGLNDSLYADSRTKAEFTMPNGTRVRVGANTQIQLIALKMDLTYLDVASGTARLFNRSTNAVIQATTPFGYVVAPAGTAFDLYVGERSLEVISLKGTVDFILNRDKTKYPVVAGSPSIVSDGQQVTSGQGHVDADWDDWNVARDRLWSKRTETRGESLRYLPPSLHDDAYELDENGRWERVYYEGEYRSFWRPTYVSPGWAPFTVGRWTDYYGDNCWIPNEPFGYMTHHYGNWIWVDTCSCWYWAPPVVTIGLPFGPFLSIPFGWCPGRVAWLYSGFNIGWFPLAPFEPYYCYRPWGPRTVVINNYNMYTYNINRYQYANGATIINKSNMYNVNNYSNVMIRGINKKTITGKYQVAPVVSGKVIPNYNSIGEKYNFSSTIKPNQTPQGSVLKRIAENGQQIGPAGMRSANHIQSDLATLPTGKRVDGAKIEPPRLAEDLVGRSDAGRQAGGLPPRQAELKGRTRPPADVANGQALTDNRPFGRAAKESNVTGGPDFKDLPSRDPGQRVSPIEPGTGNQISLPGVPRTPTGEPDRKLVPKPPGGETPAGPGQPTSSISGDQRIRPPAPRQDSQPGQTRIDGRPDAQNQRIRPSRVGGEDPSRQPGRIRSPLEDGRRMRSSGTGQNFDSQGAGQSVQPADQRQRSRPNQQGTRIQSGERGVSQPQNLGTPGSQPSRGGREFLQGEPQRARIDQGRQSPAIQGQPRQSNITVPSAPRQPSQGQQRVNTQGQPAADPGASQAPTIQVPQQQSQPATSAMGGGGHGHRPGHSGNQKSGGGRGGRQ